MGFTNFRTEKHFFFSIVKLNTGRSRCRARGNRTVEMATRAESNVAEPQLSEYTALLADATSHFGHRTVGGKGRGHSLMQAEAALESHDGAPKTG